MSIPKFIKFSRLTYIVELDIPVSRERCSAAAGRATHIYLKLSV